MCCTLKGSSGLATLGAQAASKLDRVTTEVLATDVGAAAVVAPARRAAKDGVAAAVTATATTRAVRLRVASAATVVGLTLGAGESLMNVVRMRLLTG